MTLAGQLTAYELARPDTDRVALCVFVKTTKPQIRWYTSERKLDELAAYLEKVGVVGKAIARAQFHRRPGWWCGMCDYLSVCEGGSTDPGGADASADVELIIKIQVENAILAVSFAQCINLALSFGAAHAEGVEATTSPVFRTASIATAQVKSRRLA